MLFWPANISSKMYADDIRIGKTLCHHGVKGQKWGVWNDETRRRRLGRVFGEKFLAEEKYNKIITNAHKIDGTLDTHGAGTQFSLREKKYLDSSTDIRHFPNSGGKTSVDTHWQERREIANSFFDNSVSEFKEELENRKIQPEDITEAYTKVNPMYGAPGYDDNCMACSIASWFRTKGYDVEAESSLMDDTSHRGDNDKSGTMNRSEYIKRIFNKDLEYPSLRSLKEESPEVYQQVENIVRNHYSIPDTKQNIDSLIAIEAAGQMTEAYPPGSFGVITGAYTGGGGHILNFKVNDSGFFECYDGQTGEKETLYDGIRPFADGYVGVLRLDDVEPEDINYDALFEWSGLKPARPKV